MKNQLLLLFLCFLTASSQGNFPQGFQGGSPQNFGGGAWGGQNLPPQPPSLQAGPSNSIPAEQLRGTFVQRWKACETVFDKAAENCEDVKSLEKDDALYCLVKYRTAYDECYRQMMLFQYQFI